MPYAFDTYSGNGSLTDFNISFPYINEDHVKVYVNYTQTSFTFEPNKSTARLASAPADGAVVEVRRITPLANVLVDYADGSTLTAGDLDTNNLQHLYIEQELDDIQNKAIALSPTTGLATANNRRVTEVADPTAAQDAVTKAYLERSGSITSLQIADGTIVNGDIANTTITGGKLVNDTITATQIAANAVTASELANDAVDTDAIVNLNVTRGKIANDAIDGTKIADDSVDSEHYAAGSIDTEHIGDSQITAAKIATNTITSDKIAANAIDASELADNAVDTAAIVDGAVTTAKIADNAVTGAKISDNLDIPDGNKIRFGNSADLEVYHDGTHSYIKDTKANGVLYIDGTGTAIRNADGSETIAGFTADGSVDLYHNGSKKFETTAAGATVTGTLTADLADNSINSEHYVDGSIDTAHIADNQITTGKILDNAVTVAKIADAELTTLAGMQSGTASKLASGTALTSDIADLNQIDGLTKQTTISDSDASFPTSGAVVDYVAAQIAPLGGLEVVATEVAFPNTQPSSGVVISISDAGGVVVNGSGVSTTGRTVGGTTVTINGFPSSLQGETLVAGVGLMVSSTGSSQTYNYHKILGKEDDIKQLSDDINDFNARYRVGSSNPTSALDAGDLFFNTGTNKLLVYNATNTAWEEAQSIGNFYISTFSESFDGSRTDFTLSNAPTNAQQVIISINGVIQKPNAGSSTPSEGFALSGNTVKLSNAPASGSSYFAYVLGSTVNIGTPSNNTVSTAILQNGSVTTDKLGADAVTGAKIADDAVGSEHIETLDANLDFADDVRARFGAGNDLEIYHQADSYSYIQDSFGNLRIDSDIIELRSKTGSEKYLQGTLNGSVELYYDNVRTFETTASGIRVLGPEGGAGEIAIYADEGDDNADKWKLKMDGSNVFRIQNYASGSWENAIAAVGDGQVELFHNGSKKFWTRDGGVQVTGYVVADSFYVGDDEKIYVGAGNDLQIHHQSSYPRNVIESNGCDLVINATPSSGTNEKGIAIAQNGAVELYYDGSQKFLTTSAGGKISASGADAVRELRIDGTNGSSEIQGFILENDGGNGRVNLKYGTGGGTPSTKVSMLAGGGLTFNGDTAAANALADYEEGSWTPAMSANASSVAGRYTKIGQMVHASFYMNVGSNSTSTNMLITGLPFTNNDAATLSGNISITNYGSEFKIFTDQSGNIYVRDLGNTNIPMSDFSGKWFYGELHYTTN